MKPTRVLDSELDDLPDEDRPHHGDRSEETLLRRLKRWERLAKSHWSNWRDEARLAYDFVAGKQWSSADKATLLDQMRQPVTFNRVAPMVDAVTGAEILNRQETRYLPREQGDVQVNELITAADEWARELADTEDEESDAFADVVICGLGWTETRMDYSEDPEGRIVDDRIDVFEMWSDPDAKKRNLADRRYQIRARWRDKDDLPKAWKKKLPLTTHGSHNIDDIEHGATGPRDDYEREESPEKNTADAEKRKVWIRHFQWYDKEDAWRISDPTTGEAVTLDKAQLKQVAEMFLRNGMRPPQAVKIEQNKYYQAFVAGNTILEHGPIEANAFTFNCITGRRDRNANTFYGVVRAMIDPQMWGNKFFVQIMHILNTAAKGGLLYEQGSFTNPRKALEDWAKPDAGIELAKGALSGGPNARVQERKPAVFPVGTEKMMEFALNNLPQTSGINMELLGLVEREQPGVLEMQRKKAGYAILAVFFDSLRRYRKIKGRLRLYFIQNYISDGRLVRIKGKDSTMRYVPLAKQQGTATYDVVVDEAPMSPNQKEATWQMIMGLMPMLARLEVPAEVWQVLIEYSPLPSIVSGKINEIIAQKAQEPAPPDPEMLKIQGQMQIAQQEAQLELQSEERKAELEQLKAQAELQFKREMHEVDKQIKLLDLQVTREKAGIEIEKAQTMGAVQAQLGAQKIETQREADRQRLETQQQTDEQAVQAARAKAQAKPREKAEPT